MKIRMLVTQYGSEDGFAVKKFIEGGEYEIADSLGSDMVRKKAAVRIDASEALFAAFASSNPLEQIAALNKIAEDK